jgi:hypothetical protein
VDLLPHRGASVHQAAPLWGRFGVRQGPRIGSLVTLHREAASGSLGGVAGHSTSISLAVAMNLRFRFLSLVHTIYVFLS